jgi:hypothetical protein
MKSEELSNPTLPREEWDFSSIPVGQSEACFAWEYAREFEFAVEGHFKDFIPPETIIVNVGGRPDDCDMEEMENPDYEQYHFNADEFVGCIYGLMIAENYHKLEHPWQSLDPKTQDRLVVEGTPAMIGVQDLQPRSFDFRVAFGLEEDRDIKPWFDAAAFRINWHQSDKRLLQDFASWLKRNRKHAARETRGRNRRDALNMLGAMRLLHHMPLEEAIILTTRTLGEPLYGKRSSWERARKSARDIYLKEFLMNPSNEDEPLSFPRFDPSKS